jgi:hypothetical protein
MLLSWLLLVDGDDDDDEDAWEEGRWRGVELKLELLGPTVPAFNK